MLGSIEAAAQQRSPQQRLLAAWSAVSRVTLLVLLACVFGAALRFADLHLKIRETVPILALRLRIETRENVDLVEARALLDCFSGRCWKSAT